MVNIVLVSNKDIKKAWRRVTETTGWIKDVPTSNLWNASSAGMVFVMLLGEHGKFGMENILKRSSLRC